MRLKEDKIHSRGLVHLELEGSSASNRLLRNHWLFRYGKITQTSLALRHNETTGHLRGRLLAWRRGQDSPLIIRALTPFDYQLVTFLEIAKKRNFRPPSVPILSEYTMLLMR